MIGQIVEQSKLTVQHRICVAPLGLRIDGPFNVALSRHCHAIVSRATRALVPLFLVRVYAKHNLTRVRDRKQIESLAHDCNRFVGSANTYLAELGFGRYVWSNGRWIGVATDLS